MMSLHSPAGIYSLSATAQSMTVEIPVAYCNTKSLEQMRAEASRIGNAFQNKTHPSVANGVANIKPRRVQIPGTTQPGQLNFIWWHLTFAGNQYGTSVMSPFSSQEV
jgi:hypothetical protein